MSDRWVVGGIDAKMNSPVLAGLLSSGHLYDHPDQVIALVRNIHD
jgi:hypothetical protein